MQSFTQQRSYVAFDIETSGLESSQAITVAGLLPPDRHASVILNTECREPDEQDIISVVEDMSRNKLELQVVPDEQALLDELAHLVFERFDKEYNTLIAYNAETWRSGFDFPFLRTKCKQHEMDWPFAGVSFFDLFEVVEKRFNTTVAEKSDDGEGPMEKNDLVGAHRLLCQPDNEFDPFEDSVRAVSCHYNGDWTNLVLHNVSDLHRTLDLGEVAKQYASPRDLKSYKL